MTPEEQKIIEEFNKNLFENQRDCPSEFIDILNDNFWDLIDDGNN